MPQLAPSLEARWEKGVDIIHPATGKQITAYSLSLQYLPDENTVLLQGPQPMPADVTAEVYGPSLLFFHQSSLALDGWPDDAAPSFPSETYETFTRRVSALYHALFAILCGCDIEICMFFPKQDFPNLRRERRSLNDALHAISALCALADYHGALPEVAPSLVYFLKGCKTLWDDVGCNPASWLRLATKLRSADIYINAARHLISRGDMELVAREMDIPVELAEEIYGSQVKALAKKADELQIKILRLGLTQSFCRMAPRPSNIAYTGFFNALAHRPKNRNRLARENENLDHFATSEFAEHVAGSLAGGDELYWHDSGWGAKLRTQSCRGMAHMFAKLRKAATWDCPADLLGRHKPEMIVRQFKLKGKQDPAARIRETLSGLVVSAADVLNRAFRDSGDFRSGADIKRTRCARADILSDRFTHVTLDETKLPWADEPEWGVVPVPEPFTPASRETVAAMVLAFEAAQLAELANVLQIIDTAEDRYAHDERVSDSAEQDAISPSGSADWGEAVSGGGWGEDAADGELSEASETRAA